MDTFWRCQLCDFITEGAPALAAHLMDWHDHWLITGQVPFIRPLLDQI